MMEEPKPKEEENKNDLNNNMNNNSSVRCWYTLDDRHVEWSSVFFCCLFASQITRAKFYLHGHNGVVVELSK